MISSSLRHFIEHHPGHCLLKNKHHKVEACSESLAYLLGFNSVKEVIGKQTKDTPCEIAKLADQAESLDDRAIQDGVAKAVTIARYRDKAKHILHHNKSSYIDEHGETIGSLFMGTNIDDTFEIHDKLYQLAAYDNRFKKKSPLLNVHYDIKDVYDQLNLSSIESKCLFYLIRGKTSKETATILSRSPRTVEHHLRHIKAKLNCHTKSQLIEFMHHHQLINVLLKDLIQAPCCLFLD